MATTRTETANGTRSYPGYYDSARDYALDRLKQDEPMTPADLAAEYGCGGTHMRQTLADLASAGEIERVSRGHYVLPGGEASTDADGSTESDDEDTTGTSAGFRSTADLYQEQYTTESDDADTDDATGSDENLPAEADSDGGDDLDATAPAAPLPMHPYKLAAVLGVAVALWVAYRALSGDDADAPAVEDDGADQDDGGDGLAGGLQ